MDLICVEVVEPAGPGDRLHSTYELPCGHGQRVRVSDTQEEVKRCRACRRWFCFTSFSRPHPDFSPGSGLLLTWHRCVELVTDAHGDPVHQRPAGVEWTSFPDLGRTPEGAPELRGGRFQASFYGPAQSDPTRCVHHGVVCSGARSWGPAGWVAACAPGHGDLRDYRRDARSVPISLRCTHPNCAELYAAADASVSIDG